MKRIATALAVGLLIGCSKGFTTEESTYRSEVVQLAGQEIEVSRTFVQAEHDVKLGKEVAPPEVLRKLDDALDKMKATCTAIQALTPPPRFAHRHEISVRNFGYVLQALTDEREAFQRGDMTMKDTLKTDNALMHNGTEQLKEENERVGWNK